MTAPVQNELFKRRGRRPASVLPEPSELQIHIALIAQLRVTCRPGIAYWHTPNGEQRDKRHAAKLKAMGTLPGVSDLIFVFPEALPLLCLELKARGRGLTDDQKVFRDLMRACGHRYEWTDSLDDAVRILRQYHVLP
jgi:hypothetical protein